MKQRKKTGVLIIEDNRLLRDGITMMIKEHPDLKVVGAFSDTEKTLEELCAMKADIILIDLGLRTRNSLELVKCIKEETPETKIVVMDLLPVENDIIDYVKAGADGFILKDAKVNVFLKTVSSVAAGKKVLPPPLTGTLFSEIIKRAGEQNRTNLEKAFKMSKREKQVISLIAEGLSNKEIGLQLHLSPFTIKSHVHNILEKMALHTRVQIAAFANTSREFKNSKN